jgi:glutamate/aspartate transport system substrate-binding protein
MNSFRSAFTVACVGLGFGFTATGLQAQETTGTLQKIKESGTIVLGVRDYSAPFSYLDDKQSYQGYSIDLCMKVVSAVQKKLGLSMLNVKLNPVTAGTRIPLMANGTIDLECGNTTNNTERQAQVEFAPTMFITSNRLVAKKTSNIRSLADLKGKAIVASAGTSHLKQLTILNADQKLDMTISTVKDTAEGFLMVETGRSVAYSMDDIILANLVANAKNPADFTITSEPLSVEPFGIMMRKNDPAFKKVVDDAIIGVYQSGEIQRIYDKWFMRPIPPKGINLNWPMTAELKAILAKPTASGDPAAYAVVPGAQRAANRKR